MGQAEQPCIALTLGVLGHGLSSGRTARKQLGQAGEAGRAKAWAPRRPPCRCLHCSCRRPRHSHSHRQQQGRYQIIIPMQN